MSARVKDDSPVETTVVIPSYSNFASLVRCVESVMEGAKHTPGTTDVVVVTAGYSDGELADLRSRRCRVIDLDQPAPTSESRNIGARSSAAKFLLFVDDDNRVDATVIRYLAEGLSKWTDACVVGPAMYYGSDPERLWCAGVRRSRVLMRTTFLQALPNPLPERITSEDFPNCFMVRRHEFEAVGGFDEIRFPQQWEEGDLARRLSEATGGRAYLVPQARVWHFIDVPLVRRLHLRNPSRSFLVARGRGFFTAVYGDRIQWIAYLLAAQWLFGAFYLGATIRMPRTARGGLIAGYLRGMREGLVDGWRIRRARKRLPGARQGPRTSVSA